MAYPSSGQYQTQGIEILNIQKGVTFKHPVSVNTDLRGCLLFGEIRRSQPGRLLVESYTVSSEAGQRRIIVNAPREDSDNEILKTLNVRESDIITIAGAGIRNAKVEAVSGRAIFVDQVATRTLTETRMSVKAPVLASFTFVPKKENFRITTTATAQKEAVKVAANNSSIVTSRGENLIFNEYRTLNTSRVAVSIQSGSSIVFRKEGKPFEVRLSETMEKGSSSLVTEPMPGQLPVGSPAIVGSSVVVTTQSVKKGDRVIHVHALSTPIAKGSVLNFGYKDSRGWKQAGVCKTSAAVLENSLFIPIYSYQEIKPIPANSIAYFGTAPINSFYLILNAEETVDIESGDDYACDVISVSAEGSVNKICQIDKIVFTDIWTDIY